VIGAIVGDGNGTGLDYWNVDRGSWEVVRGTDNTPNAANMVKRVANGVYTNRVEPLFHEASSLYMTENFQALVAHEAQPSIDKTYRPFGLHHRGNVYVTGAALFPRAGSWNREFPLQSEFQWFG
jgi:hypothetical protein